MNITIEQLFQKIGHLHVTQDLVMAENTALKAAQEALKAEIAKIEKDAESLEETAKGYVTGVITRVKKLL